MRNQAVIRERYLRDPLPIRLGGLAADLARVQSFSDNSNLRDAVEGLLEESRFFIEWMAPDAELEKQVALVELQRQLTRWQRSWAHIWADPTRRAAVAEQAGVWSERVLGMSGLM
ncbi:MAG: hypothetical protein NT169_08320 [Chloroflexi bacterium]|nr:hypothetical protein [Chloroflexota bacterium]